MLHDKCLVRAIVYSMASNGCTNLGFICMCKNMEGRAYPKPMVFSFYSLSPFIFYLSLPYSLNSFHIIFPTFSFIFFSFFYLSFHPPRVPNDPSINFFFSFLTCTYLLYLLGCLLTQVSTFYLLFFLLITFSFF